MSYAPKRPPLDPCPVEVVFALVGGRWKARLIHQLLVGGPARLADLHRAMPRAKKQVLISQLEAMASDGIIEITRIKRGEAEARVYALGPLGHDLIPTLDRVCEWGVNYLATSAETPALQNEATIEGRSGMADALVGQ